MHPFVVLYHKMPNDHPRNDHWDLMLLDGQVLKTWALDQKPFENEICNAIRLPDHDVKYLAYEGPIDGDRGQVQRVVAGNYRWLKYKQAEPCVAELVFDSETWAMTMATQHDPKFRFERTR